MELGRTRLPSLPVFYVDVSSQGLGVGSDIGMTGVGAGVKVEIGGGWGSRDFEMSVRYRMLMMFVVCTDPWVISYYPTHIATATSVGIASFLSSLSLSLSGLLRVQ